MSFDVFDARSILPTPSGEFAIYRLDSLEKTGVARIDLLPFSIRILLESALRQIDEQIVTEEHILTLCNWKPKSDERPNIPFRPARAIMQDLTGVPAMVDLAAMRSALLRLGGDPKKITAKIPIDLVIDHSLQVEFFASTEAARRNEEIEFNRNRERYSFLRWCAETFDNFRVIPPATGILHQINLEYLASVVLTREVNGSVEAFADTLVGMDPHSTMTNALGVLGWGVRGIEAEACILGLPLVLTLPDVVEFRLVGTLPQGATATDLALTVTQILREHDVIGKFVEFSGPALSEMAIPDRAIISNMAPEYGAKMGFFPVDAETLRYLRLTGRSETRVDLVERYCKEQSLFRTPDTPPPTYSETYEFDLGTVETCLAGPKWPQDRIPLSEMKSTFQTSLVASVTKGGLGIDPSKKDRLARIRSNGCHSEIGHGAVVIAAITSCANTSNPSVMVAAGLLAQKALERGLHIKSYVKTSLAPGSRVVTEYLREGGMLQSLSELGFNVVGFGCTTCFGNSGPLPAEVVKVINQEELVVCGVLSGNCNFEGQINPHIRASYLASPPLVVAYALAGTVNIDLITEPLGYDPSGRPVYLQELWPSRKEIQNTIDHSLDSEMFRHRYRDVFSGNEIWNAIPVDSAVSYAWDPQSTYIQEPPFFDHFAREAPPIESILGIRVLALLGDSVTTDQISPVGAIAVDGPAGQYLSQQGIKPRDFNSYGLRAGNDRVMTRGTLDSIRLKNLLVPGVEGGVTIHLPDGKQMQIFDAARKYREEGVPLMIIAGTEYGSGPSSDWAAKGSFLLGVKAVIAESYENTHRSELIGMGVLPLQFRVGENLASLGLSGHEVFDILNLDENLEPGSYLRARAKKDDGTMIEFKTLARIDTMIEMEYFRNGGILHTAIRQLLQEIQ